MVDLQEPRKIEYSDKEKIILKEQFILLLHTLLFAYLSLHNFLIPVVSNLLKHQAILQDVHYWFLLQLPVQWFLRQKKQIPTAYFYFLVLGSVARLVIEFYLAPTLKSWGILSVLVSELSSVIFYFLYFPLLSNTKFSFKSLSAIFIVLFLSLTENHSKPLILSSVQRLSVFDSSQLGCEGSESVLNFPLTMERVVRDAVAVEECGFSNKQVFFDKQFKIKNHTKHLYNLRIFKLHVLHGRVKWKFVRLIQLEAGREWDAMTYLKNDIAYVIKSPERRNLGHLVLVPKSVKEFPIGKGELSLTYDTLKWSPHE